MITDCGQIFPNFSYILNINGDFQAKLPAVLRLYRDTLTADMKTAIKTAVAELLPVLVARPLESEFTPGERVADADGVFSIGILFYFNLAPILDAKLDVPPIFT